MSPDAKDTNPFSPAALQRIIDYIEENLCTELTPALIAGHFFISVSTLSSLFKTICQMSVMEYVRNRRLSLAAEELAASRIPVIELACRYGYETPEAFTKAFTRFHGFPPSFVRRGFPISKIFMPLQISVTVRGGWQTANLTKSDRAGQDFSSRFGYNSFIEKKGEKTMENQEVLYRIDTGTKRYQKEWNVLCALAEDLLKCRIPFKVDGKTMVFAHGLEFPLDKICLTFKWKDEEVVKSFFHHDGETRHPEDGFKYFDAAYNGMKIRCMFYGSCPDADSDEFLYKNTDRVQLNHLLIRAQSLTFYYENADQDSFPYKMVAKWLNKPENYRMQNKKAWEYSAYDFWIKNSGIPSERAKIVLENPSGMLKRYADYFDNYTGVRIANICGSCGKKAIPLAVLGAEVTVFDISKDNQKYALEVAEAANADIRYEVCDVLEIDIQKYGTYFDVVFMEGGVLHYFHDIDSFMRIMYALLRQGGKMICSDFHPFTKVSDILDLEQPAAGYFSTEVFEGEMAHARFFDDAIRSQMPKCLCRKYTISEIINSIIKCGFTLEKFDEHPAWTNPAVPGEFTAVAVKQG